MANSLNLLKDNSQYLETVSKHQIIQIQKLMQKTSMETFKEIWDFWTHWCGSDSQDRLTLQKIKEALHFIRKVRQVCLFLKSKMNEGAFQFSINKTESKNGLFRPELTKTLSQIGKTCLALLLVIAVESRCWDETEEVCTSGPNKFGLSSPQLSTFINTLQTKLETRYSSFWKGENVLNNYFFDLKEMDQEMETAFIVLNKPRSSNNKINSSANKCELTSEQLHTKHKLVASWKMYDNSAGFLVLGLQMHYIEGSILQWQKWFPESPSSFVESFKKLNNRKAFVASCLLDSLHPKQRIRVVKDLRMFLINCQETVQANLHNNSKVDRKLNSSSDLNHFGFLNSESEPESSDTQFESVRESTIDTFDKGNLAVNPKRESRQKRKSFTSLLPKMGYPHWVQQVVGPDNSQNKVGCLKLFSPKLRKWLRLEYHKLLIETPLETFLKSDKRIKESFWKAPFEIFKAKETNKKKMNFPNIGKKKRKKKECLFVHNEDRSGQSCTSWSTRTSRKPAS